MPGTGGMKIGIAQQPQKYDPHDFANLTRFRDSAAQT
jgi:hypothetical protein